MKRKRCMVSVKIKQSWAMTLPNPTPTAAWAIMMAPVPMFVKKANESQCCNFVSQIQLVSVVLDDPFTPMLLLAKGMLTRISSSSNSRKNTE